MAALNIAVIGLGAITQSVHLPLLVRRWDHVQVCALVDLSRQRVDTLADRYNITGRYTSLLDLLAARERGEITIDGVLIATTGSHGPDVLACVRAGLAVLVEKPLAFSAAEIEQIGAVGGARVLLGYMKEYDPATAAAATHLAGRRLRAVDVEVLHPASAAQLAYAKLLPPARDLPPEALAQIAQASEAAVTAALGSDLGPSWRSLYSGVVLGSIVHDISLLRHLAGGISHVDAAWTWGGQGDEPGSVAVAGTLAEGARLHLAWHYLPQHPDYRETVTFHHDGGSVQLVFGIPYLLNAPTVLTVISRGEDGQEVRSEHRWNQREAFENELLAFVALISEGAQPFSSVVQGRADLGTAWQIMDRLAGADGLSLGGEAQHYLNAR